jgi:hypothetical protein
MKAISTFLAVSLLLTTIFAIVFLITTACFDVFEKSNGYYTQGIEESQEVGQ